MDNKIKWVKRLYLYIFSAVGLVLLVVGSVGIINLGLKAWVFTKADNIFVYPDIKPMVGETGKDAKNVDTEEYNKKMIEYQKNEATSRRQRQAANDVAMILVGLPLFLYHWKLARKEG